MKLVIKDDPRHQDLPGGSDGKEPACNEDLGSILGLGRSPGEGNGNPLQYSCLKNSMDRGAWQGYGPWCLKESETNEPVFHLQHISKATTEINDNLQTIISSSFYATLFKHHRILTRINISKFKCWLNCETRKIFFLGGRDKKGIGDEVQVTMHKTNNLQGYIVHHKEYSQYFIKPLDGV